jgi:hypothetical protein
MIASAWNFGSYWSLEFIWILVLGIWNFLALGAQ